MKNMLWKDAQELIKSGNTYLYCGSHWCKDCVEMLPVAEEISKIAEANNWNLNFINVDAQEANLFRDPNTKYKVLYVPSHILLIDGEVQEIHYEIQTTDFLISRIKEVYKLS
ncbi:MAG: thioredoxin family protein [Mycoplasma sp.]